MPAVTGRTIHCCISVRGMLNWPKAKLVRMFKGTYDGATGFERVVNGVRYRVLDSRYGVPAAKIETAFAPVLAASAARQIEDGETMMNRLGRYGVGE